MSFETLLDNFEKKVVALARAEQVPSHVSWDDPFNTRRELAAVELEDARKDLVDYVRSQYRL
jgi:hypothetical protein